MRIELPDDVAKLILTLAAQKNISPEEVIRKAVGIQANLDITDDLAAYIINLASLQNTTPKEALRGAVATEAHLYKSRKDGFTIIKHKKGHEPEEIKWR
jgi:hypothetical protein